MKIVESEKLKKELLVKAAAYLGKETKKRAEGTHLTDLLYPRQAYFRSIDPKPLTEDQIGYFVAGHGHHGIIEAIIEDPRFREVEFYDKDLKTYTTLDIMTKDMVQEIKTSRAWTIKKDPNENYIDQIMGECAMTGKTKARLIVFYICPGRNKKGDKETKPKFQVFEISFTKKELKDIREVLEERNKGLHLAKETGDHTKLPLCLEWMCRSCPWIEDCDPGAGVSE